MIARLLLVQLLCEAVRHAPHTAHHFGGGGLFGGRLLHGRDGALPAGAMVEELERVAAQPADALELGTLHLESARSVRSINENALI